MVWNARKFDDSRWISQKATLSGTPSNSDEVTIAYIDCPAPTSKPSKGTVLLIHGFPQTAYQFRHVMTPISDAGYRVVAPDYRGAGHSSHPRDGYTKVVMATDLHTLLVKHLNINEPVHVVGHDIGGMIAHAYAAMFPKDTRSITWGECPLPGTSTYDQFAGSIGIWHFTFHWQIDLPEQLVYGRERIYMKHFFDRLAKNPNAILPADIDHYVSTYAQPGAMRCGFDVYRGFHQDCVDNRDLLKKNGKCPVPSQTLNGEGSFLAGIASDMNSEMYTTSTSATVANSGHWCAEENPDDFTHKVLTFIDKH